MYLEAFCDNSNAFCNFFLPPASRAVRKSPQLCGWWLGPHPPPGGLGESDPPPTRPSFISVVPIFRRSFLLAGSMVGGGRPSPHQAFLHSPARKQASRACSPKKLSSKAGIEPPPGIRPFSCTFADGSFWDQFGLFFGSFSSQFWVNLGSFHSHWIKQAIFGLFGQLEPLFGHFGAAFHAKVQVCDL